MLFYEMKKGFLQKKLAIDRFITFYFRFLQEINIISPMRKLIVFFSFWFSVTIVVAQNTERKLYSIAFYNLENLFDTIHDAGKNDYDLALSIPISSTPLPCHSMLMPTCPKAVSTNSRTVRVSLVAIT